MRSVSPALLFGLAAGLAAGGCSALGLAPRNPAPRVAPSPPEWSGRAADGLLGRADLQALVDQQVRRRSEGLVAALASPDAAVRARAAFALGSVQDSAAVPALLALLDDGDPRVRADVAFALGQSADSTVALALVNALGRERDAATQRELLDALGKTGGRPSLGAVRDLDVPTELEPARALALGRYGLRGLHDRAAVDWLANGLTSSDASLREAAAYYFGRTRETAPWAHAAGRVRAALDGLAPGDPARMHLALAVGRLQTPEDGARLATVLQADPDWRVRTSAARALASFLPGGLAATALFAALNDAGPHVAVTAATALAAADSLEAGLVDRLGRWVAFNPSRWDVAGALLPALARAGRSSDVLAWLDAQAARPEPEGRLTAPFARALGLAALGAAGDAPSLDRLFAEADDDDPRVAGGALDALKARWERTRASAQPGDATSRRYFDAFAQALRRRDLATATTAAPVLADSLFFSFRPGRLLRDVYAEMTAPVDIEPMVEIVRAAGQVRDGEEVNFLVGVALGGHPLLRRAAAEALNGRLVDGIDVAATNLVAPPTIEVDWPYLARLGPRPLLTLVTRHGRVVVEMDAEGAPQTVQQLAKGAVLGRYDGVPFHRVVPNFVAQGGDFYRGDGYGGPEVSLRSEFTRLRFTTGAAGMASAGKDTEGSQYFVMHSPAPHLDGRYTAFGRVVAGQEVADRIGVGDLVLRAFVTRTDER